MYEGKTVLSVDSQVISAIQSCNQYAAYAHIHHLEPADGNSLPLEKGLILHEMLKYHYEHLFDTSMTAAAKRQGAVEAGEQFMLKSTSITSSKIFTMLTEAFIGYATKYERESFDIISVEKIFVKELYQDDEVVILLTGIIDLLVNQTGYGLIPYDHKTFGSYFKPHGLENQFQGYCWATGQNSLIVNRIGLDKYLGQYERLTLYYPTSVLEEWRVNVIESVLEHYNQIQTKQFRKNYTSCGMYGRCKYRKLCSVTNVERQLIINSEFKEREPWDPLKRDG